jgi:hypothetical protein
MSSSRRLLPLLSLFAHSLPFFCLLSYSTLYSVANPRFQKIDACIFLIAFTSLRLSFSTFASILFICFRTRLVFLYISVSLTLASKPFHQCRLFHVSFLSQSHPGLCHFIVHLSEMSPTPAMALPFCPPIRFLFPHAGHLAHMPSHIYALLGMYDESVKANQGT